MLESEAGPIAVILVGAGGFGREVLRYVVDALGKAPQVRLKGFLDDNPDALRPFPCELPILGPIAGYRIEPGDRFVMTIGDPLTRAKLIQEMESRNARFLTIIHPTAHLAPSATIGKGCIIGPYSSIGSDARVGNHVVLTWYSSLAHDCVTDSFVVLSPYSTANGGALLEEGVFLGTHAVVNPLIRVGAWSKIASGSVVYRHVPSRCLAMGNPAKARPMLRTQESEPPLQPD